MSSDENPDGNFIEFKNATPRQIVIRPHPADGPDQNDGDPTAVLKYCKVPFLSAFYISKGQR